MEIHYCKKCNNKAPWRCIECKQFYCDKHLYFLSYFVLIQILIEKGIIKEEDEYYRPTLFNLLEKEGLHPWDWPSVPSFYSELGYFLCQDCMRKTSFSGESVESIKLRKGPSEPTTKCFVATMLYYPNEMDKIKILQNFRDLFLTKYFLGKKFIVFYYKYGEKLVKLFKKSKFVTSLVRTILDIIINLLSIINFRGK